MATVPDQHMQGWHGTAPACVGYVNPFGASSEINAFGNVLFPRHAMQLSLYDAFGIRGMGSHAYVRDM